MKSVSLHGARTTQLRRAFAEQIVDAADILQEETQSSLRHAFSVVPREAFVIDSIGSRALEDRALPIEYNQSTERPSFIARTLALLAPRRGQRVLELGCGSGYTSALLAACGSLVYSVEIVGLLAQKTRHRLDALGYQNVLIFRGNGLKGWREHAPFDSILVSFPVQGIEELLLEQLKPDGGKLVAVLDREGGLERDGEGALGLWQRRDQTVRFTELEAVDIDAVLAR